MPQWIINTLLVTFGLLGATLFGLVLVSNVELPWTRNAQVLATAGSAIVATIGALLASHLTGVQFRKTEEEKFNRETAAMRSSLAHELAWCVGVVTNQTKFDYGTRSIGAIQMSVSHSILPGSLRIYPRAAGELARGGDTFAALCIKIYGILYYSQGDPERKHTFLGQKKLGPLFVSLQQLSQHLREVGEKHKALDAALEQYFEKAATEVFDHANRPEESRPPDLDDLLQALTLINPEKAAQIKLELSEGKTKYAS